MSEKIYEAYAIGALMGDGYLAKRMVRLKVTQKNFMKEFAKCIQKTYKIIPHIKEDKNLFICTVHRVLLAKRLNKLTDGGSKIPSFIINGNDRLKASFLKGFADAEGSIDDTNHKHQIVITQKNRELLEKIQELLLSLRIQSKIYKKTNNPDQLVISIIRNLKKFNKLIGFSINYKKKKLQSIINYLEKLNTHPEIYWGVLHEWKNKTTTQTKLAKKFGLKEGTLKSWLKGRRIPNQIKKDLNYGWVPKNYSEFRRYFKFLPKVS